MGRGTGGSSLVLGSELLFLEPEVEKRGLWQATKELERAFGELESGRSSPRRFARDSKIGRLQLMREGQVFISAKFGSVSDLAIQRRSQVRPLPIPKDIAPQLTRVVHRVLDPHVWLLSASSQPRRQPHRRTRKGNLMVHGTCSILMRRS